MNDTTNATAIFAARPAKLDITVTICICTRNRPNDLQRALASIQCSNKRVSQIVVSDDSDDERTRGFIERCPSEITYVEGPRSGLGANRNYAVLAATGSHVLFLDDDAELGSDFLRLIEARLLELSAERRRNAIVTGVEMQSGRAIMPNEQGFLGFQSRPYRKGEPLRTVVINATLFPRKLFDDVQFDPQLIYGYDEVDVTTQAVTRGFTIIPCFDAVNFHHPSHVGRDEYSPFTDASRLYVTLKRRRWTEGSWLRGWGGFWLAVFHAYLAAIKRRGLLGVREAQSTVTHAQAYYANFVQSANQLEHTDRTGACR